MKRFLLLLLVFGSCQVSAQKVDSIYVHLYTDSLKKGTYNYINVDGLLNNGRYLPLDSTQIIFTASAGKFSGNSLVLDKDFAPEKVTIKAVLRNNPAVFKAFDIYVKKQPDGELRSLEDIMNGTPVPKVKRKKG